jgi:hypothetical protein
MTAAARSGAAALPVRRGERRWTESELAKVHDALAAEAAELRVDIDRADSVMRSAMPGTIRRMSAQKHMSASTNLP